MTVPAAYAALADRLAASLVATAFLGATAQLRLDPESPFEVTGDETSVVAEAALFGVATRVARDILGVPRRYVVERECRLELGLAGPDRAVRLARMDATLAALAVLPETDRTLGGQCERWDLTASEDDDLPPNGQAVMLTFTLRVRSGDPLGLTP